MLYLSLNTCPFSVSACVSVSFLIAFVVTRSVVKHLVPLANYFTRKMINQQARPHPPKNTSLSSSTPASFLIQGVIQRSYNAYAVRVQGATDLGTPGGNLGKVAGGETPRIVPAKETTEGLLCIEMRIRLYHDGAMSQLLEKLANVRAWRFLGG